MLPARHDDDDDDDDDDDFVAIPDPGIVYLRTCQRCYQAPLKKGSSRAAHCGFVTFVVDLLNYNII